MNSQETPVRKKKSNGQLFKEKFGYSKSMKKNMRNHGVETVEDYKVIRKERKKEKKVQQKKHEASKVHMRANGKARKNHKGRVKGGAKGRGTPKAAIIKK